MINQIQSELPIWLASIGLVLAIFLSWWSYSGQKAKSLFPNWIRILLASTRGLVIFLVFLLLIGILWKIDKRIQNKPIYLMAFDWSESMTFNEDSSDLIMRLESIKNQATEILEDDYELKIYQFGEEVRAYFQDTMSMQTTDFGSLFNFLSPLYVDQPVAELLLITDGIYNLGPDPETAAARFPFPVSVVALGDTAAYADLKITDIQSNDLVYSGTQFPVEIQLEGIQMGDNQVVLLIETKQGVVKDTTIGLDEQDGLGFARVNVELSELGHQVITASVVGETAESNLLNNRRSWSVEVIEQKQQVAILSHAPHPDIRIIQEALVQTDRFEVSLINPIQENFNYDDYQLIILYQLPLGQVEERAYLSGIRNSRSNFMVFIGPNTNLNTLTTLGLGVVFESERVSQEDYLPVPNQQFELFTLDQGFSSYLENLPPIKAPFGKISNRSSSQVLLYQMIKGIEMRDPLFWFVSYNGKKTGFFWGEGIWRWHQYEYLYSDTHHFTELLISKAANYLSTNEIEDPIKLDYPSLVQGSENLTIRAKVYNKSLELVNHEDLIIQLSNGSNYQRELVFRTVGDTYVLELGKLDPGRYEFVCSSMLATEGISKSGVFEVLDIPLEELDLQARYGALRSLSQRKNGQFFTLQESDKLLEYLSSKETAAVTYSQESYWNNIFGKPAVLLLIVFLLSTEWIIRRYLGTR